MSEDLIQEIDMDRLAEQLGTDRGTAEQATRQALPVLLGTLAGNARQDGGADQIASAIQRDHDGSILEGDDVLKAVDPQDGEKILGHMFGGRQGEVVQALGATSQGSGSLFSKLLPMLAPLVMAWLGKRMGGQSGGGGGGLGGVLSDLLGGEVENERSSQPDLGGLLDVLTKGGGSGGSGLDDLLGGLGRGGGLGGLLGGLTDEQSSSGDGNKDVPDVGDIFG